MTPSPTLRESASRSKYHAVRTEVDGISFASKAEARRYSELRQLEHGKAIWGLKCQVGYPLLVNGLKVGTYIADFVYSDAKGEHIEDVKGVPTPVFKLKRRIFEAQYGRAIELVGGVK